MRTQPILSDGLNWFTNEHGARVCTGSQMGRTNVVPEEGMEWPCLRLFRMAMNSGGAYDSGGAYWGAGDGRIGWMYRAYSDEGDNMAINIFVRALDRKDAMAKIKAMYPQAKFKMP
jgi:hypothetical protein